MSAGRRPEERIRRTAERLRRACGSGRPRALAEYLCVPVRYFPLGGLNGFYTVLLGQPFIALHEDLEPGLEAAVLAHELGHHLLHRTLADGSLLLTDYGLFLKENRLEYEANVFACHFLIPDDAVRGILPEVPPPGGPQDPGQPVIDLSSSAARLGVPPELLKLKLTLAFPHVLQ